MRCDGGVIIGADREEGDGYHKLDRGKILATFRGKQPIGGIAIGGAGHGPYIDEVSKILNHEFCEEGTDLEKVISQHRNYYRNQVIPLLTHPQPPDYSLVIGCVGGTIGGHVYSTSGLAFNETGDYEAIGIGAAVANDWLSKLWDYIPVDHAVKLASYVIFQVKNSVGSCGYGTDIVVLKPNKLPEMVPAQVIRQWEESFRAYRRVERGIFFYSTAVEADQGRLGRTNLGKEAIDRGLEEIRKTFTPASSQALDDQQ